MTGKQTRDAIEQAIYAHSAWKQRLREAAEGAPLELSAGDICRDDKCTFGRWIHAAETRAELEGDADYALARELHAEFHRIAGAIAFQIEAGELDEARRSLEVRTEYDRKTRALIVHMANWRGKL